MELRDKALKSMGGGNPFKNRVVLIIAALAGLAIVGVLALVIIFFATRGKSTALNSAKVTATGVALAQTATPGASTSETPNPSATSVGSSGTPGSIPTVTPAATASPGPNGGATPNPVPGFYASQMSVDPAKPRKNDQISFRVTFINTTGHAQAHKVCAEIFRLGETKSFGITSCASANIPPGTSQVQTGTWRLTGIHACLPIRAHAIARDDGDVRVPLHQPNGADLWLDLQVCP